MRRLTIFIAILLLLGQVTALPTRQAAAYSTAAQAADKYAAQIRAIEEFVKQQMAADQVPGLSVGFVKDDYFWAKGYGFADLENRTPAKAESAYRLASVTKPMTAVAVLQLAERGKINLDAEVQAYVPYFPKKKWPVTVRQLLGHLGGISHYQNDAVEAHIKEPKSTREAIAIFENFDLVAEPGTQYSYTSYGYNLLGAIIEAASGKPYGEYMRENVWQPLSMNDTRMDDPTQIIPNRVRGYRLINNQVRNSEFVDISSRFAAGGTRSTVPDLLKFGKGVYEGKLLSKASYDMMWDSMQTRGGEFIDYGMGWSVFPQNGQFIVTHNGGQPETATALYVFPSRRLAIAVAANLEDANPDLFAERMFEIITGQAANIFLYVSAHGDREPAYTAMQAVFDSGRAYFYRHRKPLTEEARELAESFAYFNQAFDDAALQAGRGEALKKAQAGRHPSAKQPFVKMGSFMAHRLGQKAGPERLDAYSNTGAVTFFSDYIELYKKDGGIAKELRFSESIEKRIASWRQSWTRTNTAANQRFAVDSGAGVDALGARLRSSFSNEAVYPNLSFDMLRAMQQLALRGQIDSAVKVGAIVSDLYPKLENPSTFHGIYGVVLALSGDRDKGKQYLKRAYDRNANGVASPRRLDRLANIFAEAGMIDHGLTILQVAVEMHPRVATLHYDLGEFYLRKGMKERAVESYKKALEVNPNFPSAENARAALKRLE
jgi:CubicO group peptidase (beta-lactamase class C family)